MQAAKAKPGAAKGRLHDTPRHTYFTAMKLENPRIYDGTTPAVTVWLWFMAALIFCMVLVGGATRLTDSGLSITEWKPLLGAIPPLNQQDWQDAFTKYQQIPEFKIQNSAMTLSEFKEIYWWEWGHRFLGRIIGVAFLLPLIFFVATRRIGRSLWPRLAALFVLGGAQGALGWFMVASGLTERVDVSQYRLAAHLSLAVALFAAIVWTALGLTLAKPAAYARPLKMSWLLVPALFLQIAAGGFVAGLDAGFASDTWPKMNDAWLPDGLSVMQPWWRNLFENALAVQFNHRLLAHAIAIWILLLALRLRRASTWVLVIAVVVQIGLGIATVVHHVPLHTALSHQGWALVLLALVLWHIRLSMVSPSPAQDRQ